MPVCFVLDTDIVSLLQNGNETVLRRLQAVERSSVATTIVTAQEQLEGRFKQIKKAERGREAGRLPEAYRHLREAIEFYEKVRVLDYSLEAEDCFRKLRKGGVTTQRVGAHDLRIGSIALCLGAAVVTANARDFRRIPNLDVEDWSN